MLASAVGLLVFGGAFVVQLVYWVALRRGFERARLDADVAPDTALPPLSVVVAVRDEADRLPTLLAALTGQTHPQYEVVLVDDASMDATPEIVRAWQRDYAHLRLCRIENPERPRKKHALARGIEAASHDLIAFTDADCEPPPDWLAMLAAYHAAASEEVLLVGYSPFRRAPGLFNRLARYETFVTGFLTAAAIGLDRPYMAVGRNLSYARSVFQRIDGFEHSRQSMSGDDDLLVQEVVRRGAASVRHVSDPRAFVPSEAPATWREGMHQKLRHLSAGRFYDRRVQRHLAVFHATGILLWVAPLGLGWAGAGLLFVKLLFQGQVLRRAAHALRESDLLPFQPFLELLYAAYNAFIAPVGLLKKPKRW